MLITYCEKLKPNKGEQKQVLDKEAEAAKAKKLEEELKKDKVTVLVSKKDTTLDFFEGNNKR